MEFNVRHAEFEMLMDDLKKNCDNQLDLPTWKLRTIWIGQLNDSCLQLKGLNPPRQRSLSFYLLYAPKIMSSLAVHGQ